MNFMLKNFNLMEDKYIYFFFLRAWKSKMQNYCLKVKFNIDFLKYAKEEENRVSE